MITFDLWKTIIQYIETVKKTVIIEGIVICGSLPNNKYQEGSDVDLLLISNTSEFSMKTVLFKNIIFDTMISSTLTLTKILNQSSSLSDVFSLSFGLNNQIIEESEDVRSLLKVAESNINSRNLTYLRPKNKSAHIFNETFYIKNINGVYKLLKDGKIVI